MSKPLLRHGIHPTPKQLLKLHDKPSQVKKAPFRLHINQKIEVAL